METTTGFKCMVNRNLSLEEMIAAGKYEWVDGFIVDENYSPVKRAKSFELVRFGYDLKFGEVIKELEKSGLRPADLVELLAFGAAFPEEQLKYDIMALGSEAEIGWVHIQSSDIGRMLCITLGWDNHRGKDSCRFLAVRD